MKSEINNSLIIQKYFSRIGITDVETKDIKPNLELLRKITYHHVSSIPFHNFSLFERKKVDLSNNENLEKFMTGEQLYERIVNQNEGGMCFENSLLLYYILTLLNYNVKIIPSNVLLGKPINPSDFDKLRDHNILLVIINDNNTEQPKTYIVDIAFGMNSLRYPLEIKTAHNEINEEIPLFPNETFKIEIIDEFYQLNN